LRVKKFDRQTMRKAIIGLLLLLTPAWLFAQTEQESYEMYAQYLHLVKAEVEPNATFVVRESTDYGRTIWSGIPLEVRILRRWYKNGHSPSSGNAHYDSLRQKIKHDTTWISLMVSLNEKMAQRYVIANRFSPDLHVTLMSGADYNKTFEGNGPAARLWGKFEKKYRGSAYLIELSAMVSDGKRALFYISRAWGEKASETALVFFEKVNGKWVYFDTDVIFMS
jgi:hypothetical protein